MALAFPAGSSVTIKTRLLPDVTLDLSGTAGGGGVNVAGLLKPSVTISIPGLVNETVAPFGTPGPSLFPFFAVLGVGVLLLAGLGAAHLLRRG